MSFDQALIPPRDGERFKAVLPQTEIEYHEANAEHAKQMQVAAVRPTKYFGGHRRVLEAASGITCTETVPVVVVITDRVARQA